MTLRLLLVVVALCSLEGCIVVRDRTVVRERECRPSEYWDGTQCRHKGQGHGAHRHD